MSLFDEACCHVYLNLLALCLYTCRTLLVDNLNSPAFQLQYDTRNWTIGNFYKYLKWHVWCIWERCCSFFGCCFVQLVELSPLCSCTCSLHHWDIEFILWKGPQFSFRQHFIVVLCCFLCSVCQIVDGTRQCIPVSIFWESFMFEFWVCHLFCRNM